MVGHLETALFVFLSSQPWSCLPLTRSGWTAMVITLTEVANTKAEGEYIFYQNKATDQLSGDLTFSQSL